MTYFTEKLFNFFSSSKILKIIIIFTLFININCILKSLFTKFTKDILKLTFLKGIIILSLILFTNCGSGMEGLIETGSETQANFTPVTPITYIKLGRTLTINFVYLEGSEQTVLYTTTNTSISIRVVGNVIDSNTNCGTCVTQFYIRLNGFFNLCLGSSTNNWSFDESDVLTTPSTPGIYYVNPASSWDFSCQSGTTVTPDPVPSTVAVLIIQ